MITAYYWKKGRTFEASLSRAQMLSALKEKDGLLWVDLEDPTEFESECLIEIFNFHDLAVEDCLVDHSQPKIDDYEEYLFLVVHAALMRHDEEKKISQLSTNELDIFFGNNYVVTFHKMPLKAIASVREGSLKNPDRFMGHGTDLLVHAILDHLVDNYMPVLDQYDAKVDKLEEELLNHPPANYLSTVVQVKQDIFNLRRVIAPQRETINYLIRNPGSFIRQKHLIYFRDVYDHLNRIYATAESFHENMGILLQVYFSYSSHKLNEVVKHMTVLATLTMPTLLVASIYGMNFKNMPELNWEFGYHFSIALSIAISVGMLLWMKFKKWI